MICEHNYCVTDSVSLFFFALYGTPFCNYLVQFLLQGLSHFIVACGLIQLSLFSVIQDEKEVRHNISMATEAQ